jgi:hypothetical protein
MIDFLLNFVEKMREQGLEKVIGRYYSSYPAKVTDNKDPERLGKIKVKVPSLFADNELTSWARPKNFPNSGNKYGTFIPPEIDDWVWVEFHNGDTRYPNYMGGWVAKEELHEDLGYDPDGVPTKRGIVFKNGSRIVIDETKDKDSVTIASKSASGEQKIVMSLEKDKEKLSVLSKSHKIEMDDKEESITVTHKANTVLLIDKKGSLSVKGASGVTISFSEEDGTMLLKTKDGASVKMKDKIEISDKSGSNATLSDSGIEMSTKKDVKVKAGKAMMNLVGDKVKLGTDDAEVVDILHQTLTKLGSTTAPGYGAPISTVGDFIQLATKLQKIKG